MTEKVEPLSEEEITGLVNDLMGHNATQIHGEIIRSLARDHARLVEEHNQCDPDGDADALLEVRILVDSAGHNLPFIDDAVRSLRDERDQLSAENIRNCQLIDQLREENARLLAANRRVSAATMLERCALMEQTIREQRDLNDRLAFELGGLKWEIGHVRRLLRRSWSSVSPQEDETIAQEVVKYLAGVPATE